MQKCSGDSFLCVRHSLELIRIGLFVPFLLVASWSHESAAQSAAITSCEGLAHPECHALLAGRLEEQDTKIGAIGQALADAEARVQALEARIIALEALTSKPMAVTPLEQKDVAAEWRNGDASCAYDPPDENWVLGNVIIENPSGEGDCRPNRFVKFKATWQ